MSATVAAGQSANTVLTEHNKNMVAATDAPNPKFKFLIIEYHIFPPQLIVEPDSIMYQCLIKEIRIIKESGSTIN
jgi:hypothetical protein